MSIAVSKYQVFYAIKKVTTFTIPKFKFRYCMSEETINVEGIDTANVSASNGTTSTTVNGYLNIFPGSNQPLSPEITKCLTEIQNSFPHLPLWVIMQNGDDDNYLGDLSDELWQEIYRVKEDLKEKEPIIILCVSPGGDAESAYRIAKLIRNKCGDFSVLIPFAAKSAATLLSLGAKEIIIGKEGDLGPLDVQIGDMNEERIYSGLDEVQSIDGLFEFANNQVLSTTLMWSKILRKKKQLIFPSVIDYVTGMMKPLIEKIDTIHYMSLSRKLRIAEEYASRLLAKEYGHSAKIIANRFVENYPYHGFIIDINEGERIGLKNIKTLEDNIQLVCDELYSLTKNCESFLIGKFYTKNEL